MEAYHRGYSLPRLFGKREAQKTPLYAGTPSAISRPSRHTHTAPRYSGLVPLLGLTENPLKSDRAPPLKRGGLKIFNGVPPFLNEVRQGFFRHEVPTPPLGYRVGVAYSKWLGPSGTRGVMVDFASLSAFERNAGLLRGIFCWETND